MNWSLIIFCAVVAFFTYRGFRNGLLRSLSRVGSLIAGYLASIFYTKPVAAMLDEHYQLQGLLGLISAAILLFIAAGFAVSLIFWCLHKFLGKKPGDSTTSSVGGAAVGLLTGLVIAIISVWMFAFVRDSVPGDQTEATATKPNAIENLANRVAGSTVNGAITLISGDKKVAALSSAIIESPAETLQQVQRLAVDDDLVEFLNNPKNQQILNSGNARSVQRLPAFLQLTKNPDLLALAKSTGMADSSATNLDSQQAELAQQVTDIWGRVQRVKNDERVLAILNDPEFQRKIQSDNPFDLLSNPALLELTTIIFSEPGDSAPPGVETGEQVKTPTLDDQPQVDRKRKVYLYSWTDEDGQKHISNIDPIAE